MASKKLDRKIIVLTGPLAAGKTTIKLLLKKMLARMGVPYEEIYAKDDLYIPFALDQNIITKKEINDIKNRDNMTKLMESLYQKFGKDLGTTLLCKYLSHKSKSIIYILDSKRNPKGINAIKEKVKKPLIVGVHTDFQKRCERFKKRDREFDKNLDCSKKNFFNYAKKEEDLFQVSRSLQCCDLIIENNEQIPLYNEVQISKILVDFGYLHAKLPHRLLVNFPINKTKGDKHTLTQKMIPPSLDLFFKENKDRIIFVIQGGNRYIVKYLKNIHKKRVEEIKITSLTKVALFIILNSFFTPKERIEILKKPIINLIIKEYLLLPTSVRKKIEKELKKYSVTLKNFLCYSNRGDILELFTNFSINTPFKEPSNDKVQKMELKKINEILHNNYLKKIPTKKIVQYLFVDTKFHNEIKKNKKIVFIDDTIYRGRTLFTIMFIMDLFDVEKTKWSFYFLCSGKLGSIINSTNVKFLNENFLYPFENNPKAEKGYWLQRNSFFSFCDLNDYKSFLFLNKTRTNNSLSIIVKRWDGLVDQINAKIKRLGLSKKITSYIVELFIFYCVHNLTLDINIIMDQRAKNIGYCMPFVKIAKTYINQKESSVKRAKFNNSVCSIFLQLQNFDRTKKYEQLFNKAFMYYELYNLEIDYSYIKNI